MKLPILGTLVPVLGTFNKRLSYSIFLAFALTGCSTVRSPELAQFTRDDLNAAIAIAEASGDAVAAGCYTQIRDHYTVSQGPAIEVKGLFSAHAAARQARRAAQAGVPEPVHLACSPLVVDAQKFVIRRILD